MVDNKPTMHELRKRMYRELVKVPTSVVSTARQMLVQASKQYPPELGLPPSKMSEVDVILMKYVGLGLFDYATLIKDKGGRSWWRVDNLPDDPDWEATC